MTVTASVSSSPIAASVSGGAIAASVPASAPVAATVTGGVGPAGPQGATGASGQGGSLAWSTITATPTTMAGYGITDAVSSSDSRLTDARTPLSHVHSAADIASGTVATARLGSGDASSTNFLRGDGTWATPSGGGSSSASDLTSGTLNESRLSFVPLHPFLLMGG